MTGRDGRFGHRLLIINAALAMSVHGAVCGDGLVRLVVCRSHERCYQPRVNEVGPPPSIAQAAPARRAKAGSYRRMPFRLPVYTPRFTP